MNILKKSYISFLLLTVLFFCFETIVHAALQLHLPLDGNLNDISGNGNNGAFRGGSTNPGFAAAVYNQGLNFDGINDYITVPSFDPSSTFSASLWVNHDNIGALNTFIEHANNGNNRNDFYIGYDNSNNQLTVELEDNNSTEGGACGNPKFCTGIVLNSNRWYHVVVTVTPTTLNVYIDTTLAYTATHSTAVNFGNGSWLLGGDTDNNPVTSANNDYLDGRIDEVRIYNHELGQVEISALYGLVAEWNFDSCNITAPNGITDSSGNGYHATGNNGVTTATGRICTAGSFDGTDDYASLPGFLNLNTSFTISSWINPNAINSDQRIFADDESNSNGFAFSLGDGGNGRLRLFSRNINPVLLDSSAVINTGSWYHVVAVHDSINKTRQIFVNGADVTGGPRTYTGTWGSDNGLASIGGETDGAGSEANANWRFNGLIDEVRIYNRALSTEEINGYYINPDPLNRACPTCGGGSQTIILSTDNTETLGGLNFSDGSLVEYDPVSNLSTLYFNENLFSGNEDINAVHVLTNGIIILSTENDATLGGLSFGDDDLIAYDPSNNTATLYFNGGALFSNGAEDIDAVYVRDNGNIILSTQADATLGGLSFQNGDLVEYNPGTNVATLLLDENQFSNNTNIDGVHILANGNILLSTSSTETLGGLSFSDGSIAEYNPGTNTTTLYFDENLFSGGADINALTLPPLVATFDHIEFVHDGAAITCSPEPITVKACANADCSILASTAVTVNLSPTTASSSAITWFDSDSKTIMESVDLTLQQTTVGNLTLGTVSTSPNTSNPVICKNAAGTVISCTINFVDSGFIFINETDGNTILPTQLAGKDSNVGYNAKTISLQAVKASDSDPTQCLPAFQNKTLNIDFAAECNNPSSCLAGQLFNLTSGAVIGNLTATTNDNGTPGSSSYDTRSIAFDGNGKSNIIFNYPESGLIELHARHNILLPDGITQSDNYMSGSTSFVVRPLALALSNISYVADASGTAFKKAGEDFITTLTAVRWQATDDIDNDGVVDTGANLVDNATTQNFGNENITPVTPSSITTSHTVTLVPNTGILTNSADSTNFTNGAGTKTYNWSEVGIFNLTTTLTNYLASGDNVIGNAQNIGRFIPHHFDTLVTHACNSFTYSDQPFIVTVSARNSLGNITGNYRDTFAYGVTLTDANPAGTPTGTFANNSISFNSFSSDTINNGASFGVGSTEVANNFSYTFTNKETIPDILEIRTTDINDTTISSNTFAEGSTEIRSGRTRVENSFGSELVDMPVITQVEYYNTNGFEINAADTCSAVDVTLTDIGTDPITLGTGAGQTCLWDDAGDSVAATDFTCAADASKPQFSEPASSGNFNINLKSPGADNTGDIGVSLISPIWLKFDWDGDGSDDNDPTGIASFGLYRGDDRIIYWREVF